MNFDRSRAGALVARWTTELVVVFVGVYGAFVVTEWDENREREDRAEQLRSAIAEEVRDIQHNTYRVASSAPAGLDAMDSMMAAGSPFPLRPQMEPIGFRTHVWDASLASGALSLLDFETFYLASVFYNELNEGFEQIRELSTLSRTMLLPVAGDAPATFFEPAGDGQIQPKAEYAWYLPGLRRLGRIAHCVTVLGDSLLVELGEPLDSTYGPLDPSDC